MTSQRYHGIIDTPCGPLGYVVRDGSLTGIDFLTARARARAAHDQLGRRIEAQLRRYFETPGASFDLPMQLAGTSFQQRVWRALRSIPTGTTRTYGELARQLRSGARAVGSACRANPIPIVIPCHRVTAASGLGGYCGATEGQSLRTKHWLITHEARSG